MKMLQSKEEHDVRFLIGREEKWISANRLNLTSISPVFQTMLNLGDAQQSASQPIKLPDIDFDASHLQVLAFAYFNVPDLNAENVNDVIYVCNKYQINDLMPACLDIFKFCLHSN